MARPSIFRQAALDRLSSPEQLDELMHVTDPRAWMALGALGLVLVTALAWGVWGSIPTKVKAEGILIRGERLFKVAAPG
ncbi:MAG TPA: NHLP bacteriocin system secretion protein, partial [Verrucomicrobiae bacterium]|nr:NHLP bacteriocin system secretion protein [Verrucomicrobiae bacterium]